MSYSKVRPFPVAGMMTITCLAVLACMPVQVRSQSVAGWRGDGTSRYPDAKPPTTWSPNINVAWSTAMPGASNASPVPMNGRLYLCAEPATLLCVDAATGAILWQRTNTFMDALSAEDAETAKKDLAAAAELDRQIGELNKSLRPLQQKLKAWEAAREKAKKEAAEASGGTANADATAKVQAPAADDADIDATNASIGELNAKINKLRKEQAPLIRYRSPATHADTGYTSPTPVSDGTHVWVDFGTGVTACYDTEGTRRWIMIADQPAHHYGHSSSPIIVADKLLVLYRQLVALDPLTGETLYRVAARPRWGTPTITRIGGMEAAIMPGGEVIRVIDGRIIARNLGDLNYSSATVVGDVLLFVEHPARAFRLPVECGDTIKPQPLWQTAIRNDRYYASPLHHEGLIYAVTQNSHLTVLDIADGSVVYEKKLELGGGVCYPNITLGGNHIYVSSDNGTTAVVKPGRAFDLVATNKLEPFRASPVFVNDVAYIRGMKQLYCLRMQPEVGEPDSN